jgi:antitoxin (DNA-binding transcriptional repressor) of toxin-antitoxin stability system
MKVYTYSEARQWFARLLDEARAGADVVTRVTAADIVSAIRESRERES